MQYTQSLQSTQQDKRESGAQFALCMWVKFWSARELDTWKSFSGDCISLHFGSFAMHATAPKVDSAVSSGFDQISIYSMSAVDELVIKTLLPEVSESKSSTSHFGQQLKMNP